MKLLLCTDGSDAASAAVDLLTRLGLPGETEVMVLHVIETREPFASGKAVAETEKDVLAQIRGSVQEQADSLVERETERCLKAGWAVRTSTPVGVASEQILDAIGEFGADLVVVGALGAGGRVRGSLGRTARRVVKFARCAVLVTRPFAAEAADGDPETEARLQILVAFDGSSSAKAAVASLAQIPLEDRAEITLLTVLTVSTTLYGQDILERMSETWKEYKRDASVELEAAERALQQATPNVSLRMLDGGTDASDEIIDAAQIIGADLVMVGRTGKSGLQRFLLGSVSGEVVEYAPCSVWVAPGES